MGKPSQSLCLDHLPGMPLRYELTGYTFVVDCRFDPMAGVKKNQSICVISMVSKPPFTFDAFFL